MVTYLSHKPQDAGSNPVAATNDDLIQLAECYPDTIAVDGSSPSVITASPQPSPHGGEGEDAT